MEEFCIIAFQSGNDAAMAQQAVIKTGIPAAMMPTPRGLTASCGLSLRFKRENAAALRSALDELFPEGNRYNAFAAYRENGNLSFSSMDEFDN